MFVTVILPINMNTCTAQTICIPIFSPKSQILESSGLIGGNRNRLSCYHGQVQIYLPMVHE